MEDANPMFMFAIPAQLRKNSTLMEILNSNSKQLISHYDIFATLTDIVKVS